MKVTFTLLWAFVLGAILVDGLSEGDQCTARSHQPGVCSMLSKCYSVRRERHYGIRNHVVCGYKNGWEQIVCCPLEQPVTDTTPRPLTTTTLQPVTTISNRRNRISVRKCNEYKEFAYNKTYKRIDFGPLIVTKVSNCAGVTQALIYGGEKAIVREFPHMALVGFEDGNTIQWTCGGSLISEQFVLSASHCFESRDFGEPKYVRLGEHDKSRSDDGTAVDLRIIDIITHPEYLYSSTYDDIGLLKLERWVEFNGAIRPICLPEETTTTTNTPNAIATGWGNFDDGGMGSNVLRKVRLEVFEQDECNVTYAPVLSQRLSSGISKEKQVCAGSHTELRDACQGDSGGPLQVYHATHNCTYTIIGVTSFGQVCGALATPGVYTRVYPYLDWIERIVWPNQ